MKKYLIAAMVAVMCVAFAACGDSTESEEPTTEAPTEVEAPAADESSGPQYTDISYVKEITSSTGFDMEVYSVTLTPEGEVYLRAQGDLAEAIGWEKKIAVGVHDIYVEEFGNGGFYSILMIRDDKTVTAVNTSKLRNEKTVELINNVGSYQDVSAIEAETTEDAHVINAVLANGDKYLLDPYLE